MGGVVSARKAQYFEPKYESKPSARVAPGRTGSDIFPDKKAASDAPVAPAAGSELYTILCKLTAKPGKGAEVYRYFHAELDELLTGPPEDIVMKPAAIHKGVRTKPRNRSIAGREPLGLFEPKGPHFHKEPVVDKSWNSVPVGQSLPGYYSQPC